MNVNEFDLERAPHGSVKLAMGVGFLSLLFAGTAIAQGRYPAPPPANRTNPAAAASNAAGAKAGDDSRGPVRSPFDPPAGPAASAGNAAQPTGSAPPSNPFRSSAAAGGDASSQPLVPLSGESRPMPDAAQRPFQDLNQRPTTPAGYDARPASPYASAQPTTGNGLTPSGLMRAMLTAPSGSQLRGQPLALVDLVSGARSRGEQTQRVEAYWDLCSSVADYYLGLREQEELRRLGAMSSRTSQDWAEAETRMATRVDTSRRAALAAQLRVASFIGGGTGYLPLPTDIPHCASYTTHYDRIFTGGSSVEARELAALLPLRFKELRESAAAVTQAENWLDSVAKASKGEDTGPIKALDLLALQRRAFVQIARDYNRRIARYSELASPGQVSAGRLTGMLIKTTASATATRPAAPAPPPSRQSNSQPQRTFVENAAASAPAATSTSTTARPPDEGVQQTSAMQPVVPPTESSVHRAETSENGEHSVLVKQPPG